MNKREIAPPQKAIQIALGFINARVELGPPKSFAASVERADRRENAWPSRRSMSDMGHKRKNSR
jgi:hypothetical protein